LSFYSGPIAWYRIAGNFSVYRYALGGDIGGFICYRENHVKGQQQ
jgi:hypothetical protein